MCEFRFRNQVFRVCCVYAPNSNPQRNQFLDDVFVRIESSVSTAEATDTAIANSLLSNVSSTLPSTQADLCDGPLSFDECLAALNGMARTSCLGRTACLWNFM